ncbi:rhodanese-like domain-containing protein [Kitasatospora camelliae]|uniref:Rhodanese-like domain-containing protein n=1 Tax=Kitasatospora camelliae TaxID=3156397 RepID=A0AAU8K701_9ACTN
MRSLLADGAHLVDAQLVAEFAAGHIPGALSNPLRPAFATWLGWLLPDDAPLVFVLGPGQDPSELDWQAAKIGYDRLAGHLAGGINASRVEGGPVETIDLIAAEKIGTRPVLDVRQDSEFAAGHIPGATHTELGDLATAGRTLEDGAVVMCGHGERAMTAASLLARHGTRDLAVLVGGAQDWTNATGRPLEDSQ